MSNFNVMYPEGKKITIAGEEFVIKPYVLKNRTKVLRVLSELMIEYVKQNPDMPVKEIMGIESIGKMLVSFISVAGERLVEIYEVTIGKSKEWLLENVALSDEIAILTAVWEVNEIPFLFEQVKSLIKASKKTEKIS